VNKPAVPVTKGRGAAVVIPDADPGWHRAARMLYESLPQSGQAEFYQQSDWMAAWLLCESISRELEPQPVVAAGVIELHALPPKGAAMNSWRSTMAALLVTEGDRRRLRLELEREEAPEEVTSIDRYRRRLGSAG
jgi:hypothetical protein